MGKFFDISVFDNGPGNEHRGSGEAVRLFTCYCCANIYGKWLKEGSKTSNVQASSKKVIGRMPCRSVNQDMLLSVSDLTAKYNFRRTRVTIMMLQWFHEHDGELMLMSWTTDSPDLNPTEHIWDASSASTNHRSVI